MLIHYFKTMFRNLWRNKTYSLLNILGLAIGIACAALIFLWVEDEVNYDSINVKKDRLYAVRVHAHLNDRVFTHWSNPGLLGPVIKEDMPGVVNTCRRTEGLTSVLFGIGDKTMYAGGCYAEPSLFSMFTLPFVQGDVQHPFTQLYSIVVTEAAAKKFFGDEAKNCIGKTVRMDNTHDYVVSGLVKDIPENASLQFEWVAPFEIFFSQNKDGLHDWDSYGVNTYVELQAGAGTAAIDKQMSDYIQQKTPGSANKLFLFGMNDWHLYDEFEEGRQTGGGRIRYVHLFSIIAWVILVIACINFMNLATARSERRAREVGVRKVLGAGKRKLVAQFIGEALFMSLLAALVGLIIVIIAMPVFNLLVQKQLSPGIGNPLHIGILLLITVVCGLVAGSYPSLYLSSFNPVFVLKGLKMKGASAAVIRKGLVIVQFSVSIILIVCTIIIYQQIQHVKNRDLGFKKDNLVEIRLRGNMANHFAVIKQDLINTGAVENAALSDHATITGGNNTTSLTWQGKAPGAKILISVRNVSPEFMVTSGLKVLDGREFEVSDSAGSLKFIITASFAKLMGTGSAVGKRIANTGDTTRNGLVVGVVSDYVYGNMYNKPDPVLFVCLQPRFTPSVMYLRMKAQADPEQALAQIAAVIKKDNPLYPFDYRFVNDQFNRMFLTEILIGKLSRVFASLAIIISCLGLFGLAAYTAERRTREIGIRKVLGASVPGIAALLSKDFLQLILIAAVIAFPLSFLFMHRWLQDYAYRVNISWWVFIAAGAGAMLIAIMTISFQAVKAAIANPVKSLRTE